ncbi:hypothetical protein [Metamycoplasma arthritidis]|uniref:hypothetical protein n=2 Tax=Metamycoplasma arthritidis TaxID=2111 RepID=UPI00101C2A3F|nr:hypothetical protein [Metamycoplasma arthritidis]
MKQRIVSKSLGTYLLPGILILIMTITFLVLTFTRTIKTIVENQIQWLIFGLAFYAIVIEMIVCIYFIFLIYYDDKRNGINFFMQANKITKKQRFFSDFFVILLNVFAINVASIIISGIFVLTLGIHFDLTFKIILIILLSSTLFLIVFLPFSFLIAFKLSTKSFALVAMSPIILGFGFQIIFIQEEKIVNSDYQLLKNSIEQKAILSAKQAKKNKALLYDRLNFEYDSDKTKIENIASVVEQLNNKKISPYFSWMLPTKHIRYLTGLLLPYQYSKIGGDENKYLTYRNISSLPTLEDDELTATNSISEQAKYSLLQLGISDSKLLRLKIKQSIANLEKETKDLDLTSAINNANENDKAKLKFEVSKRKLAIDYLSKISGYKQIFESQYYQKLINSSYDKINSLLPFNERQGNILLTYQAILEKVLGGLYANDNENAILNKVLISKESLALSLTFTYYLKNKQLNNFMDLAPLKKLKGLEIANLNEWNDYSSAFRERFSNSIINYELIDKSYSHFKEYIVREYYWPSLSVILPFVFSLILFLRSYRSYLKKDFNNE